MPSCWPHSSTTHPILPLHWHSALRSYGHATLMQKSNPCKMNMLFAIYVWCVPTDVCAESYKSDVPCLDTPITLHLQKYLGSNPYFLGKHFSCLMSAHAWRWVPLVGYTLQHASPPHIERNTGVCLASRQPPGRQCPYGSQHWTVVPPRLQIPCENSGFQSVVRAYCNWMSISWRLWSRNDIVCL